ncbi:ImmA/IrrE family metallo-endopeptidase [Frankia sp. R43]|uniref:ImmA/IrrE family metallo-endopeptidase n=1 Tax=Frankia sp. R43 TaxID=269536 RepID=UPI0009FA4974|nr:ImmA/IrrE family metallo-endopeptidase [Frankia sp. R43]
MDIGAHARFARLNAELVSRAVEAKFASFNSYVREFGARAAAEQLGIAVTLQDRPVSSSCSVAGSSDAERRSITVVRAAAPRMTFTALHEIAHVEGATDDDFQQALYDMPDGARDAEEDACEAFAARILLPDSQVDAILDHQGCTAAGMAKLVGALPNVSREACAVAIAHRLRAPGYAAILRQDGSLQFAARSGDSLSLRRASDQSGTDLWAGVLRGGRFRDQGHLAFSGGSLTSRLYLDALRVDDIIYVVGVVDSPDWPVLHLMDKTSVRERHIEGHCDRCEIDFVSTRSCPSCGAAIHDLCGVCDCPAPAARGARTCRICRIELPPGMFLGPDSEICNDDL